jgi:hypothetical protein
MHAKKIAAPLFALAFGLALAGFAGAVTDAPASPDASKDAPRACCHHEGATASGAGAHCAHAKSGAKSGDDKSCCAKHAAMKKDGAKGSSCCCEDCAASETKGAPAKS